MEIGIEVAPFRTVSQNIKGNSHFTIKAIHMSIRRHDQIRRRSLYGRSFGQSGPPYIMAYSVSKGSLATLTKNNANALRFDRIRVNGISMSWTYTPNEDVVQKNLGGGENWLQEAEAQQPFGRILRPFDIAYLAAYLLSDQAEMMTGSLIDLNQNVIGAWD